MFILKRLHQTHPATHIDHGTYHSLDEAIDAALGADLDLATALIEEGDHRRTVSDWIELRSDGRRGSGQ